MVSGILLIITVLRGKTDEWKEKAPGDQQDRADTVPCLYRGGCREIKPDQAALLAMVSLISV